MRRREGVNVFSRRGRGEKTNSVHLNLKNRSELLPRAGVGPCSETGEMALRPMKTGGMFIFTEAPLSSHMLELQKKKKKSLKPVPKTSAVSSLMLHAIKENKADPCSHLFAFLTGSQKRFIV